jgi:mannosyltransferase OCH1-like enzyme
MSHSFPKIIWQTHNHKKEWLPHHLNQIAATWVNLNPGWEYRYVDQVQRDEKVRQYPEIYEIYLEIYRNL